MSDSYKLLETRISQDKTCLMLRKKIVFFEEYFPGNWEQTGL